MNEQTSYSSRNPNVEKKKIISDIEISSKIQKSLSEKLIKKKLKKKIIG